MHATLIRAAARWQGIKIAALELEQIGLLYDRRGLTPAAKLDAVA